MDCKIAVILVRALSFRRNLEPTSRIARSLPDPEQPWLPDGYIHIFRTYAFSTLGFWTMALLRYAAKFDPFLSLDCASNLAQSKERKGSNFTIWQPCRRACTPHTLHSYAMRHSFPEGTKGDAGQDILQDGALGDWAGHDPLQVHVG